jgi:hypothetical protein
MAGEKARHMLKRAQDSTAEAMREWEENGALRHLHGKRLDLSDDSPDWFVHNLLKHEGLGPPALERAKDLDAAQHEAERIVERIRRRRAWLVRPEARCTPEAVQAFNAARERALDEYRAALTELNRAILTYNLAAPSPLHRRGIIVDAAVESAAREVLPLEVVAAPVTSAPHPGMLGRVWRHVRGER